MKNPHGVEPTRYMKKENSGYGIECDPDYGPVFGKDIYANYDICIGYNCNEENSCDINNDGNGEYECHPVYKKSLFVNTDGPDKKNYFSLLDYEVYYINYEVQDTIYRLCKYPDIIWEYIETKDISEESLKQFDNENELRDDLDIIHIHDSKIRVKISQYYLKNPSEYLLNTQLVDKQYDNYLREWTGNSKWRLLYRASEHDYTARSFHEYCDDINTSTLIIIKSTKGWIFGGYTTQSWSGHRIDLYSL